MLAPLLKRQAYGGSMAQDGGTVTRVRAASLMDVRGNHPLGRWLVSHAMKASKCIGSVNVKVSSDEC